MNNVIFQVKANVPKAQMIAVNLQIALTEWVHTAALANRVLAQAMARCVKMKMNVPSTQIIATS